MLAFDLNQALAAGVISALVCGHLWLILIIIQTMAALMVQGKDPYLPWFREGYTLSGRELRLGCSTVVATGFLEFAAGGFIRLDSLIGVVGFVAAVLTAYAASQRLLEGSLR